MFIISAAMFIFSLTIGNHPKHTEHSAYKLGQNISKRIEILDNFIQQAAKENNKEWMNLEGLPKDMVIYRYIDDSLRCWANQFPIVNDNISKRLVFQRLTNLKDDMTSPLSEVDEELRYVNYGYKWYLVKSYKEHNCTIIGGLEIKNTIQSRNISGINPVFNLDPKYTAHPLSNSDGSTVYVNGKPLFKLYADSFSGKTIIYHAWLSWSSLVLFILSIILYLYRRKNLRRYFKSIGCLVVAMVSIYFWGRGLGYNSELFSPTLYADGPILYSLGAILTMNTLLLLVIICTYMIRYTILRKIKGEESKKQSVINKREFIFCTSVILSIIAICIYIGFTLKSIILNSSISLELYKINTLNIYTCIVYISYILLMGGIALLIQILRPYIREHLNLDVDIFSLTGKITISTIIASVMVIAASVLGFQKESNKIDVWANRLSIDRDISLEIQLRTIENSIANDAVIASLVKNKTAGRILANRISEYYMYRIMQDYDLHVYIFDDNNHGPKAMRFFNERIRAGVPIADNSRFIYSRNTNGQARYTGLFTYIHANSGLTRMFIAVESKSNREDKGYASILGYSSPGKVILPQMYSYAKYLVNRMVNFKGNYAYPTILTPKMEDLVYEKLSQNIIVDGYIHFINRISDDEAIIISRPKTETYKYFVAAFFIGMITFLLISLVGLNRKKPVTFKKNYYKSRINTVLMVSLVMTLLVMVVISVLFVHRRNEANIHTMMSNKINSIQALVENCCRFATRWQDLQTQDFSSDLDEVANTIKTDIILYTTGGKAFLSTSPDVFNRMIIGPRLNEKAYENIIYKNKRYYIKREKNKNHKYYLLCAPVFNSHGDMIALLSSPYTDKDFAFKTAAAFNIMTMITAFLILLIFARLTTTKVVDKMFMPLLAMGKKMNAADISNLEYIIYERNDEISTLVRAYNLMVHDLSKSTKQLAQAERDKAWATMARQVAHEIKNPLTPIKLQIQRVIRLKEKGNPIWQDRFDSMSKEVLLQINILADTANEFSTFAKLYTEEAVKINIDNLLKNEIALFDSKDNITFSYMGLDGAEIMGPKPQLIRVAVNLISNAIQAIESRQEKEREAGMEPIHGEIVVSLRNSTDGNYYDIVIEDNGSGVKDKDRVFLFTPNFTTKNSGTGLGLAICRNILEKCNASIEYSKSFVLQGACFTIKYPKES